MVFLTMSLEQLKAFLEKFKGDISLQEKLIAAANANANADAVLAIAKEAGFVITIEDIKSMESAEELSDEELEGVAGGLPSRNIAGCASDCYMSSSFCD